MTDAYDDKRECTEESSSTDEKNEATIGLDWRDFVAFTIALLQTQLLPFVLLFAVFGLVGMFLVFIWICAK